MTLNKIDYMDPWTFSFGALMTIAIQLDTQLDKALKPFDLTSKQWYLLMTLDNFFQTPPTLKEASAELGTSYQNVKQVALKLQAKGFLNIIKDPGDARLLRLELTEEAKGLNEKFNPSATTFLNDFYKNVSANDMLILQKVLYQLMINIKERESVE